MSEERENYVLGCLIVKVEFKLELLRIILINSDLTSNLAIIIKVIVKKK
jgi:hypothetical protein